LFRAPVSADLTLSAVLSDQCEGFNHRACSQGGDPSWQDVYAAEVQTATTGGFTVNIARLDKLVSASGTMADFVHKSCTAGMRFCILKGDARVNGQDNSGWGQQLRLDYIAFPEGAGGGEHDRYRSGQVQVGKSHDKNAVRITVTFASPFTDLAAQPRVLCSPRSELHHDYTDVHAVVVHETWNAGFNATVKRVDRLGEGWGSKILLGYVAVS
jgi:hypothetical protein